MRFQRLAIYKAFQYRGIVVLRDYVKINCYRGIIAYWLQAFTGYTCVDKRSRSCIGGEGGFYEF